MYYLGIIILLLNNLVWRGMAENKEEEDIRRPTQYPTHYPTKFPTTYPSVFPTSSPIFERIRELDPTPSPTSVSEVFVFGETTNSTGYIIGLTILSVIAVVAMLSVAHLRSRMNNA